jgi:hypothetical protein
MTVANTDEFLAHFGVKGMKWGVRKEEALSGDSSVNEKQEARVQAKAAKTAAAEMKTAATQVKRNENAKKYEIRADLASTRISELQNATYKYKFQQKDANKQIKMLEDVKATALKDAEAKRNGKLSSNQKKVIIGAVVVSAIIAAAVVNANVESGNAQRLIAKGKAAMNGTSATDFKKKAEFADKTLSPDDVFAKVVHGINTDYGKRGTVNNCRRATFTYEMRRRGFDVKATRTDQGSGQTVSGLANAIGANPGKKFFSGSNSGTMAELTKEQLSTAKHRSNPLTTLSKGLGGGAANAIPGYTIPGMPAGKGTAVSPSKILDRLAKEPNGSRGELGVAWLGGGAHSLAYEIFDGKPVVFDTQSGQKYHDLDSFTKGVGVVKQAGFTRLDNVDLNKDFLLRWMK